MSQKSFLKKYNILRQHPGFFLFQNEVTIQHSPFIYKRLEKLLDLILIFRDNRIHDEALNPYTMLLL